ncbi:MAG: YdbH domain-containing protein, partial [Pseudomonadota bacterium]|nr:YdbH domain-containing protein [Pseudomonadota bacterium]
KQEIDQSSLSTCEIPILPFAELEIKRSIFRADVNGEKYRIPFSLQLKKPTAPTPETTILNGTLRLYPRNQPVTLKFTTNFNKNEGIHLSLQVPRVELPNFRVSDIDISIKNNLNNTSLQGHWTTRLAGRRDDFIWNRPLQQKWHLKADLDPDGAWQASLNSPNDGTVWELQKGDLTISANSPAIALKASGQGEKSDATGKITIQKPTLKSQQPDLDFKLPDLNLHSELQYKDSSGLAIETTLQFAGGTLQIPDYDLRVVGIAGTLPWHWPASRPTSERKGKLSCRKIFLDNLNLGHFSTSLQQQGEKILLKGCYDSALVAGLKMITDGHCELGQNGTLQAAATFAIPACKPAEPIALGKFSKSAADSTFDGSLSAHGRLSYKANEIRGSATAIVEEGIFRYDEKNLLCNGINCRLQFPELPSLRSAPDQRLVFDQLTAGNISCRDGCFAFRVESAETLLLEKSRISWCGGNIETQALRISPTIDHYQSTLHCDRLQLAKLLEQLGQIKAQGQGSVNGRIPVAWENGRITFDDGFLYSTPGVGGNIKVSGGEALTAGLPIASPQFAQLDLAREALKDYQYKWTKLGLNSEAEELILNLQFDGKPNLPLPFIYKKELGGFARVTAGSPGSHFQGISLDINLRLPLNQILRYKDIPTMIQ